MDETLQKSAPKISLTEALLIGITLFVSDLIGIIPGAAAILDLVVGAPIQFYLFVKGVGGIPVFVSNILDLFPILQEIPTRTLTWIITLWLDHHSGSVVAKVAEKIGDVEALGEGGLEEAGEGVGEAAGEAAEVEARAAAGTEAAAVEGAEAEEAGAAGESGSSNKRPSEKSTERGSEEKEHEKTEKRKAEKEMETDAETSPEDQAQQDLFEPQENIPDGNGLEPGEDLEEKPKNAPQQESGSTKRLRERFEKKAREIRAQQEKLQRSPEISEDEEEGDKEEDDGFEKAA